MSLDTLKTQILEKVALSQVIGTSVTLKKSGNKHVGCCPFHAEKTPSFYIFNDRSYYCFGCQASGDAINYLRNHQGLSFIEALKHLGGMAGIDVSEISKSSKEFSSENSQNQRIRSALGTAQRFFRESLSSDEAHHARDLLNDRGFPEKTWETFGFGWAPSQPNALIQYLKKFGFNETDLVNASLATEFKGNYYDFFRDRLMVPIYDHQGKILAFGGRALKEGDLQKYKNSRYDKGKVLFNHWQAKKVMRTKKRAIVVEGYMDALKMIQYGFPETVACQGTNLTKDHLNALKLMTDEVILLFDGDDAGKNATLKLAAVAPHLPELSFKVVRLPENADPDSFLRLQGADKLDELLDDAPDLLTFFLDDCFANTQTIAIPNMVEQRLLPWIKTLDPLKKDFFLNMIQTRAGISLDTLGKEVKKVKKPQVEKKPALEPVTIPGKLKSEIISHLYFAKAEDIDLAKVAHLIEHEWEFEEVWEDLAFSFLDCLAEGKSPESCDLYSWPIASSQRGIELLKYIQSQRNFFKNAKHMQGILGWEVWWQEIKKEQELKSILLAIKNELENKNWEEYQRFFERSKIIRKEIEALKLKRKEITRAII